MQEIGYKNEQESSGLQQKLPRESTLLQKKNTQEPKRAIKEKGKDISNHQSGVADESAPASSILPDNTIGSGSDVHAEEDPDNVATSHIADDVDKSTMKETFGMKNKVQNTKVHFSCETLDAEKKRGADIARKEEHHVVGLKDEKIVSSSSIDLSHNHDSKSLSYEDNAESVFPLRETNNRSGIGKYENERHDEVERKSESKIVLEDEANKGEASLENMFGAGKRYPEPYLAGKPPRDVVHLRQQKTKDGEIFVYAVRFRVGPLGLSFDNRVRATDSLAD